MKVKHTATDPTTAALFERAMIWRQRMEEAGWSAEDEAALEVWLQADARHLRVFDVSGEVWSYFDDHATSPELIGAHRALLGRVQKQALGGWGRAMRLRSPGRLAAGLAAAAVLAAAVLAGAGLWPLATQGDVYQSGVGERRVVKLQDGSVLSLDALSRVSVRYTNDGRQLTLERGQARFDVAHDQSRPFTVTARNQTVVATGTAFNIDMIKPQVRVTLIEGRVLVLQKIPLIPALASSSSPIELRAGQALVTPIDAKRPSIQTANIEQATAWQDGKLNFDGEPLAEAVERVNRYTNRKIRVADAKAGAVLVYGTFDTGDVDAFIGAVNGFLPVRAVRDSDGVILQSATPDS